MTKGENDRTLHPLCSLCSLWLNFVFFVAELVVVARLAATVSRRDRETRAGERVRPPVPDEIDDRVADDLRHSRYR